MGLTAVMLAARGLGAWINRQSSLEARTVDDEVEPKLETCDGEIAVRADRECRENGMAIQVATRQLIYEELQRQM